VLGPGGPTLVKKQNFFLFSFYLHIYKNTSCACLSAVVLLDIIPVFWVFKRIIREEEEEEEEKKKNLLEVLMK
jgi:hypothetical protein